MPSLADMSDAPGRGSKRKIPMTSSVPTYDFEGRTVVVTGIAGALGEVTAAALSTAGAKVLSPADPIEGGPDLSDETATRMWYDAQEGLWASIHIAGGFCMAPILETDTEALERMWRMNARSCFFCCREAVRSIRATGNGGRIVNVAAQPALEPRQGAGMTAYTMSKAAVAALTEALGEEVAREGILVNALAPAILDTPTNREAMPDADRSRWAALTDVAEVIGFLASPANQVARSAIVPVYGES